MPIKYTEQDILRICKERVEICTYEANLKKGLICEWSFEYPNGEKYSSVVCSFPVSEENYSSDIGKKVCADKITRELWDLCGKYSLVTGEKL